MLVRATSSHYATMIQNTRKYANNMIINTHIHMCSTRAKHLRIDMALIPLMGSYHRKKKSYDKNNKVAKIESSRGMQRVDQVLQELTLDEAKN